MSPSIRPARPEDIPDMTGLLLKDAQQRQDQNPAFWPVADDAALRIETALKTVLKSDKAPFGQKWLVAEAAGGICGLAHVLHIPVPPIYAGDHGAPGLMMEDCCLTDNAPPETGATLIAAAEDAMRTDGAQILLAQVAEGSRWQTHYAAAGYVPLTLYLSKTGFADRTAPDMIRPAGKDDIPRLVEQSARHRAVLEQINIFWKRHPEADARFDAWMHKSLTLTDRDMLVAGPADDIRGYAIAQPASPLHFPPAHDLNQIGVIDDFFHANFAEITTLSASGAEATDLLRQAEAAFARRDMQTAMIVCPAHWPSKISLLKANGYDTAIQWLIKR
ncbi:hypothetical protein [Pseudaestuariivita rosea]|uniref:hypothetical protein n=1 Tax=Pseudaestuariivita rosea TaxID=2763263 RepID=UPI001ABA9F50|nr:hypothetical protein [Pseudaestuariivita rosea]